MRSKVQISDHGDGQGLLHAARVDGVRRDVGEDGAVGRRCKDGTDQLYGDAVVSLHELSASSFCAGPHAKMQGCLLDPRWPRSSPQE